MEIRKKCGCFHVLILKLILLILFIYFTRKILKILLQILLKIMFVKKSKLDERLNQSQVVI